MTDLDQFRAELAGSLAGLSPSQRLKAGREMADRLAVVLAAIERGEIDASATETATISSQRSKRRRLRRNDLRNAAARCGSSSTTASVENASRYDRNTPGRMKKLNANVSAILRSDSVRYSHGSRRSPCA